MVSTKILNITLINKCLLTAITRIQNLNNFSWGGLKTLGCVVQLRAL